MASSCASVVRSWFEQQQRKQQAPVILLTFSTSNPKRWLLGLSAALHGVPLVVAGFGHPWNVNDTLAKVVGTLNAVTALHEGVGGTPTIVFADATDTVLLNSPSAWLESQEVQPSGSSDVLVSGECASYPTCYASLYDRHAPVHVQACASRRRAGLSRACFVNSGSYLGKSSSLLQWLRAVVRAARQTAGVEAMDDQAAIHRHFLRSPASVPSRSTGAAAHAGGSGPSPAATLIDLTRAPLS